MFAMTEVEDHSTRAEKKQNCQAKARRYSQKTSKTTLLLLDVA